MLENLGASLTSGGTYQNIKKRIKEDNIDISHFSKKGTFGGKARAKVTKLHWSKYLVYHRTSKREKSPRLRKALLEYGRKYECTKCGLEKWNNTTITLEIHHLNGDCLDNTPENLQFLCPNCHSQI